LAATEQITHIARLSLGHISINLISVIPSADESRKGPTQDSFAADRRRSTLKNPDSPMISTDTAESTSSAQKISKQAELLFFSAAPSTSQ
jgi:hypothetical protein